MGIVQSVASSIFYYNKLPNAHLLEPYTGIRLGVECTGTKFYLLKDELYKGELYECEIHIRYDSITERVQIGSYTKEYTGMITEIKPAPELAELNGIRDIISVKTTYSDYVIIPLTDKDKSKKIFPMFSADSMGFCTMTGSNEKPRTCVYMNSEMRLTINDLFMTRENADIIDKLLEKIHRL